MSTNNGTVNAVEVSLKRFRISKVFFILVLAIACYIFFNANDLRLTSRHDIVDDRSQKSYHTNGNGTPITNFKAPPINNGNVIPSTNGNATPIINGTHVVINKATITSRIVFQGKYNQHEQDNVRTAEQTTQYRNETLVSDNIPTELRSMEPQIFEYVGKKRLPNYKNPCWYDKLNKKLLQCVPYFFLLGVTKCGTSDVWEKLSFHEQIVTTVDKESHWWTQRRYVKGRTFSLALRRGTGGLDLPTSVNLNTSKKVIGDGSPSTFWDYHNWRSDFPGNTEGPPYVVADLIHAVDPDAKLIVIFREPVSRMYSSYNFFKGRHVSPEEFHQKVVERLAIFQKCLSVNSLRACAYQDKVDFKRQSKDSSMMQVRIGIYHVFLEDWLRVFPRNQLFILELQDWNDRCEQILPQLFEFLNLERLPETSIKMSCFKPPRNKRKYKVKPMLPKTKKLLEEFYQPYNFKLYEMLQDSRFNWTYA